MKCPCCKYEYTSGKFVTKQISTKYKSGKNKGKPKVSLEDMWEEGVGTIEFETVQVIERLSKSFGIETSSLNICSKCGVAFKEVECVE